LFIEVDPNNQIEKVSTKCRIYLDSKIVKTIETTSNTLEYEIEEDGIYRVLAYIYTEKEIFEIKSSNIEYFESKKLSAELAELYDNDEIKIVNKKLKYVKMNEPFVDFVLTHGIKFDSEDSSLIDAGFKTHVDPKHPNVQILHLGEITKRKESSILFSGMAKVGKKIIWGQKGISNSTSCIEEVKDMIGNYSCIILNEKEITVSFDFFGMSKLYYYQKGDIFCVSNRYHLLLCALSDLGVECKLDEDVSLSYFCTNDVLAAQLMDERCLTANTYSLQLDKKIKITSEGISFEANELANYLTSEEDFSEEEYIKMLSDAKDEIISNLDVCFQSPHFDNIIIDITGGMDSRIVFSALTHVHNVREKTTMFTFGDEEEVRCASALPSAYGLEYDSVFKCMRKISPSNYDYTTTLSLQDHLEYRLSYVLGTYFEASSGMFDTNGRLGNTIHITGGCGEPVSRPYFSNHTFPDFDLQDTVEGVVTNYVKNRAWLSNSGNEDVKRIFSELLSQSIRDKKCTDPVLKYEDLYLYYRARYHFDSSWNCCYGTPVWMPLQSKSAFIAFRRTYPKFKSRKFVFDLIYTLSPHVASFEYVDKQDNKERLEMKDTYDYEGMYSGVVTSAESTSENFLKSSEVSKKLRYTGDSSSNNYADEWKKLDRNRFIHSETLRFFKTIMLKGSPGIKKRIGASTWHFLKNWDEKDQRQNRTIVSYYKKLGSIVFIMNIVEDPFGQTEVVGYTPPIFNYESFIVENEGPQTNDQIETEQP